MHLSNTLYKTIQIERVGRWLTVYDKLPLEPPMTTKSRAFQKVLKDSLWLDLELEGLYEELMMR